MSERESEKIYEQLVRYAGGVIGVVDEHGVVMFTNDRAEYYTGMYATDIVGHHFTDFVHPADIPECLRTLQEARTGNVITDFHFRALLPDGTVRHMLLNGGFAEFKAGTSMVGVFRDVTESADLGDRLLARNSALAAISQIAVTLSGPGVFDDKLRIAMDRVLEALGLRTGAIIIKDSHGRVRVGASSEERLAEIAKQAIREGRLLADACMERGETIVVPDMNEANIDPVVRELSRQLGVEAFVAIPLRCGGTVKAALSLAVQRNAELDVEQLEFLDLAAGILGPAIENASLNSDLADRASRLDMLDRLAKSINAGRDVHTVLQTCMRELANLVSYDLGVVVLLEDREADVFPFARNGVPMPGSHMEMGREQLQQIGTVGGPIAYHHGGPKIPFHRNPDTFQPSGGSGAVAPLIRMGQVFGLLKVWFNEADSFGVREIEILESVAEHLSVAAHNAGLFEAERRKSLELAALTKETHHRIRNNLQVISGLLSMSLTDEESSHRALERCLRQVLAISAVHDLLSPSDMSARIRLDECLTKIGTNALHAAGRGESIELSVCGDSCPVTSDAATAVGIIVNELVSNAIEHGFCGRESGRVEIRVRQQDKTAVVEVIDDGNGLPEDFLMPQAPSSSSGLGLMASLATYGLGGALEVTGVERGTGARISFRGMD